MGGMPWDTPGQQPYQAPQQPQYSPPPPPPRQQQQQPQQMQPDIPAPPRPQHNDLQTMIQNTINEAVAANKEQLVRNAQKGIAKAVKGEKVVIEHRKVVSGDGAIDEIEEAFEGGPVTTRTFAQGFAVDIGFALMAAATTVIGPGFDAFDKEAWTIVGALMLKTFIQTGMSYMMKLEVK